jgi:Dockerin type I domain
MSRRTNRSARVLGAVVLAVLPAQRSLADFDLPAGWARGATDTTYQQWDIFTSADGNPPNLPDVGLFNPNAPGGAGLNVFDSSGTSLITSDSNIYSFAAPTDMHVVVPNYGLGSKYTTVLLVQTRTLGSEIEYADAAIGTTHPAVTQELLRQPLAGPFGETFTVDTAFTWVLPGNAASYQIDLPASASSMSFDRVAVDTLTELTGDVTRDGVVNGLDISNIASHWLQTGAVGARAGDANFDGIVNGLDIGAVASNWLHSSASGGGAAVLTAVPEPGTHLLASAGAMILVVVAKAAKRRTGRQ